MERIQQFVTQFGTEADGSSHFKLFIDYHTYSQMWLYPWGYLYSAAPHDDEHDALSAATVAAMRELLAAWEKQQVEPAWRGRQGRRNRRK